MKKTFYILNTFFIPTPYNHRFFVEKFAKGFGYSGFEVKVVSDVSEITDPGFVMVSFHNLFYNNIWLIRLLRADFTRFFNGYKLIPGAKSGESLLPYAGGVLGAIAEKFQLSVIRKLRGKDIIVIAWFSYPLEETFKKMGLRYILSGDYYYTKPAIQANRRWYEIFNANRLALPVRFAADINPEEIGLNCYNDKWEVCYIGNGTYHPEWYSLFKKNEKARIVPTPPYIPEEERVSIYKNAMVSLGLHDIKNSDNGNVTERVFESLALGAVCVTDNPSAEAATQNCAVYFKDKEDLLKKVDFFLKNTEERKKVRERGFRFIKEHGTYASRAEEFIALAKEQYGAEFE